MKNTMEILECIADYIESHASKRDESQLNIILNDMRNWTIDNKSTEIFIDQLKELL